MYELTEYQKHEIGEEIYKPLALLIIFLGVAAIALIIALAFFFGAGVAAAGVLCVCLIAAGCCFLLIRRKINNFAKEIKEQIKQEQGEQ